MASETRADHEELRRFATAVLECIGVPGDQAEDAANVLVWANLRGIDTHGVRNLKRLYVRFINEGRITPAAHFQIEYETPASARVNGGNGLGLAAARWAMRLAVEKASNTGIAFVAMRNSHHFGAAGHYPWMALSHDMIGVGLTGHFYPQGSEIGVVPTFSAVPMFSTNPIAVGFPTLEEPPFLLDMATSIAPYNRIMLYKELGRALPPGWGTDAEGEPATDPSALRHLLPLGGSRELGGHKGYGLSMMVNVLCAVLSGGWELLAETEAKSFDGYAQERDAHFFGAFRIDLFRPAEEFKRGMDTMIRAIHAAPKAAGADRIFVAGEIEHETELDRRRNGIPLAENIVEDLRSLSITYGIPSPI